MPKKYVIQKKQVKRYFKRNKQWLLGIAAIVAVFFIGLMYASANGHLVTINSMLKGQVAGQTSTPYTKDCPNDTAECGRVEVATLEGASVSYNLSTKNPPDPTKVTNCGLKCGPLMLKVGHFIQISTSPNKDSARKFLGWIPGNNPSGGKTGSTCPCTKESTCEFFMTGKAQKAQKGKQESAIACFAKYDDATSIKVANKLTNASDTQKDGVFGTITEAKLLIACSRTVKGTSDTGVCNAIKKGPLDFAIHLMAKAGPGYEFVGWKAAGGGKVPCSNPASPTCSFLADSRGVDVVAEYKDPRDIPVRASVSYFPGNQNAKFLYTPSKVLAVINTLSERGISAPIFTETCTYAKPCMTKAKAGDTVTLTAQEMVGLGGGGFTQSSSFHYWGKYSDPRDGNKGSLPDSQCPCQYVQVYKDGREVRDDAARNRSTNKMCTFVAEKGKSYDCAASFGGISNFPTNPDGPNNENTPVPQPSSSSNPVPTSSTSSSPIPSP